MINFCLAGDIAVEDNREKLHPNLLPNVLTLQKLHLLGWHRPSVLQSPSQRTLSGEGDRGSPGIPWHPICTDLMLVLWVVPVPGKTRKSTFQVSQVVRTDSRVQPLPGAHLSLGKGKIRHLALTLVWAWVVTGLQDCLDTKWAYFAKTSTDLCYLPS